MTEIDHYAEAEKDIAAVNEMYADDVLAGPVMARAQVHATLALADAYRAPAPDPIVIEAATCDCEQLVPAGAVCATCGHHVMLHEAHEGPCTVTTVKR